MDLAFEIQAPRSNASIPFHLRKVQGAAKCPASALIGGIDVVDSHSQHSCYLDKSHMLPHTCLSFFLGFGVCRQRR